MTSTTYRDFEEAKIALRLFGQAFRDPLVMRGLLDAGVAAGDFTAPRLSALWTVCVDEYKHHQRLDPTLVQDALAKVIKPEDGVPAAKLAREAMTRCLDAEPIRLREELPSLVEHMRRRVAARRLATLARDVEVQASQPRADPLAIIDDAKARLEALASGASALRSANGDELALLGQRRMTEGAPLFEHVPLGLPNIDDMLGGGAVRGRVTVVGAGTGVGKSTYATHIVLSALNHGHRVLWFVFESDREEISTMLVEMHAGYRYPATGKQATTVQGQALAGTLAWLATKPIYIDDASGLTVEEVRSRVLAHKQLYDVDVVVVDYVQDIERSQLFGRDDLNYAYISKSLRKLAKDENLALIELSQVSELEKDQKRLDANNTAFSKQFGRDGAAVVMVERDQRADTEKMRNTSRASLVKNRSLGGRLGEQFMHYDWRTGRISPCTKLGDPEVIVDVANVFDTSAWDDDDA